MEALTTLFQDPNFLQGLGRAGEAFSRGEPAGVALNPSELIQQIQNQKAGGEVLAGIFGPPTGALQAPAPAPTSASTIPTGASVGRNEGTLLEGQPIPEWLREAIKLGVTPQGSPGLDAFDVKNTADGSTITMRAPSPKNLSTYGTNVPAEAVPATVPPGGERDKYQGFFQALLGQE